LTGPFQNRLTIQTPISKTIAQTKTLNMVAKANGQLIDFTLLNIIISFHFSVFIDNPNLQLHINGKKFAIFVNRLNIFGWEIGPIARTFIKSKVFTAIGH